MKLNVNLRTVFLEITCLLYIVLFIYAATNKLLDFENFQVQLGQSPLLSSHAGWVSWLVPVSEIIIAGLLFSPKTKLIGLYCAFSIMILFTSYIVIILNFSPFVPCSCGGVLEKMNWEEHLAFNVGFLLLVIVALLTYYSEAVELTKNGIRKRLFLMATATVIGIGIVVLLFLLSENEIHHRNNFIRRFAKHATTSKKTVQLPQATYYIAGVDDGGKIYLGNLAVPLEVTIFDINLAQKKKMSIDLPNYKFRYTAPRLTVRAPYFYFSDGNVPCIFIGDTINWKAHLKMYRKAFFTNLKPIDNKSAIIRAIDSKTKENTLGLFTFNNGASLQLNGQLLTKQIDGVFDTDGSMLYNSQLDKVIYTYAYRNEFLIIDSKLKNHKSGHTIDTTTHAQVSVVTIKSKNVTTLAKQPKVVNKLTATFGDYLFVNAALIGKYEPEIMWEQASIIDVYNLKEYTYAFSFYVYNIGGRTMDQFVVLNDWVISLNGKHLTVEKLQTNYYKPFIPK
jgi:hypothetical protein